MQSIQSTEVKNLRLAEDQLVSLSQELTRNFKKAKEQAAGLLENVALYRDLFNGKLPQKPERWSSNVNIPLIEYLVKSASKKLSRKLFGRDPIYYCKPEDSQSRDFAPDMEISLQAWLEYMRFPVTGSVVIDEALKCGQAWLENRVVKTDRTLTYDRPLPATIYDLDVEMSANYVVTEDMILIPFTAPSFERAKGAFARRVVRWTEILSLSDQAYKSSLERTRNLYAKSAKTASTLEALGIDEWEPEGIWEAEFPIYEGFYNWVAPDKKDEQRWFMTVYYPDDESEAIVLRCVDYAQVFGDIMFSSVVCDPQPNSLWGRAMVESLAGLQLWTNSMFNQVTDAVTMALNPPLAVGMNTEIARRKLKWGPRQMWPVSPGDVQTIEGSMGALTAAGSAMNQMENVRAWGDRIAFTTDVTSGTMSQERRTAKEIGVVVETGNEMQEHIVVILQLGQNRGDGFEGFAQKLTSLLARYLPSGQKLEIPFNTESGRSWREVGPEAYQGNYRWTMQGTTSTWDPSVRAQRAFITLESVKACPFTAIAPIDKQEIMLSKIQRLWEIYRSYYQGLGHQNVEEIIGEKPRSFDDILATLFIINPDAAMPYIQAKTEEAGINTEVPPEMAAMVAGAQGGAGPQPGGAGGLGQGAGGGVPESPGTSGMAQAM